MQTLMSAVAPGKPRKWMMLLVLDLTLIAGIEPPLLRALSAREMPTIDYGILDQRFVRGNSHTAEAVA